MPADPGKYFEPMRWRRPRWFRNLVATPWRWRWEWGVPAGLWTLGGYTHPLVIAGVLAAGVVGVVAGGRRARSWVVARVAAVVVQHRLRVGMVHCGLVSWSGRLPAILLTRVVESGIRMTLWLPAGVAFRDAVAESDRLAVACWAAGLHVTPHARHSQLIVVLVERPRYRQPTAVV